MSTPYFPVTTPMAQASGIVADLWRRFFEGISGSIASLTTTLATVPGVKYFTIATQPALGAGDVGYVGYEQDTRHYVWFDGAAWQALGESDMPGRLAAFAVAPVGTGWVRCNGGATTYLVLGNATLTTAAFTTPNLAGTPAYMKDGAYTGTIAGKAGSTATGSTSTGTGTTGTGTTGTDVSGSSTDTFSVNAGIPSATSATAGAGPGLLPTALHQHTVSGTTAGHTHTVPGLTVPGLSVPSLTVSVPALAVGTIEMANLTAPVYFRR